MEEMEDHTTRLITWTTTKPIDRDNSTEYNENVATQHTTAQQHPQTMGIHWTNSDSGEKISHPARGSSDIVVCELVAFNVIEHRSIEVHDTDIG
jgi:hypothetical protein